MKVEELVSPSMMAVEGDAFFDDFFSFFSFGGFFSVGVFFGLAAVALAESAASCEWDGAI